MRTIFLFHRITTPLTRGIRRVLVCQWTDLALTGVFLFGTHCLIAQHVGINTTNATYPFQVNVNAAPVLKVTEQGTVSINNYTLPALDGAAGRYLTTDGLGTLKWSILDSLAFSWKTTGNNNTNSSHFLGTTDNQPLRFKLNNQNAGKWDGSQGNYSIGLSALNANTTGTNNIALGNRTLITNTVGHRNIAVGDSALYFCNASDNVAIGPHALKNSTTGQSNIALGTDSQKQTTTGYNNVSAGTWSLRGNTTGYSNVAYGHSTLLNNASGHENTAIGTYALLNNTGSLNTAIGFEALKSNTIGWYNTALGYQALKDCVQGYYNTAVGYGAGPNVGTNPINFTALGYNAGHVGSNTNTIEIGNTSVSWIGGQVSWSIYSDGRIKENIRENVPGLAFINRLRPVTYNINISKQHEICGIVDTVSWEGKYDIEKIVQSGFIAQEVANAANACGYDFNGVHVPTGDQLYSLQYETFVVPLVKAVQELSDENQWLKDELARLLASSSSKTEAFLLEIDALEQALSALQAGMANSANPAQVGCGEPLEK